MAGAAYADGASKVNCTDGTIGDPCGGGKHYWNTPLVSATGTHTSTNVLVNGKAVVLAGDPMESHPDGSICTASPVNHAPALVTFSSKVKVNGKGVGRVGDEYSSSNNYKHTIADGSSDVTFG